MGKLEQVLQEQEMRNIVYWCLKRQITGFQGRADKQPDSCYSFWLGASLSLLDSFSLVNDKHDRLFLDSTQDTGGGFGKHPDAFPGSFHFSQCLKFLKSALPLSLDVMHTFLSISAISLRVSSLVDRHSTDVLPVFPALNISERALKHLRSLQQQWKDQSKEAWTEQTPMDSSKV